MITHTNARWQGMPNSGIPLGDPIVRERTVIDCASAIARYELGFGGQIIEATEDRLVIHTPCLGSTDVVTMEGPRNEMRTLLQVAATWCEINGMGFTEDDAERVVNTFRGNPLLCANGGFMLIGQGRWRTFATAVIAEREEHLRPLTAMNDDTLEAAFELRMEGFGPDEILEAVA